MELDYNTARNAIKGDSKAQSKLLSHYDSYINALSIRVKVRDPSHRKKAVPSLKMSPGDSVREWLTVRFHSPTVDFSVIVRARTGFLKLYRRKRKLSV